MSKKNKIEFVSIDLLREKELKQEEDQAYREQYEAFDRDWPATKELDFNLDPETIYEQEEVDESDDEDPHF